MRPAPAAPSRAAWRILTPRHARVWSAVLLAVSIGLTLWSETSAGARVIASATTREDRPLVELSTTTTGAELADCPCGMRFTVANSSAAAVTLDLVAEARDGSGVVLLRWASSVDLAAGERRRIELPWRRMPDGWATLTVRIVDRPESLLLHRAVPGR